MAGIDWLFYSIARNKRQIAFLLWLINVLPGYERQGLCGSLRFLPNLHNEEIKGLD